VFGYITLTEQLNLSERIAIITFGQNTRVMCSLTSDYASLRNLIKGLNSGGSTPMAEGLALAFKEVLDNGNVFAIGEITIQPRIILLTDGEPDNKDKAIEVAKNLGTLNFPISAMGVSGCNQQTMRTIAETSGGIFLMVNQIDKLVEQFLTQIYLILFVIDMQNRIEEMFNKYFLKQYLEEKLGRNVSEEELDLFIIYLHSIVRLDQNVRRPSVSNSTPLQSLPPPEPIQTYTPPSNRPRNYSQRNNQYSHSNIAQNTYVEQPPIGNCCKNFWCSVFSIILFSLLLFSAFAISYFSFSDIISWIGVASMIFMSLLLIISLTYWWKDGSRDSDRGYIPLN